MSSLSSAETLKLEELLLKGSGAVLDFSNRAFTTFFAEHGDVDINSERYLIHGDSQEEKLRAFWQLDNDVKVGKVLAALVKHAEANTLGQDGQLASDCLGIASRLMAMPSHHGSAPSPAPPPPPKRIPPNRHAPQSALLVDAKAPETFSTRQEAADYLAKLLADKSKRLIIVKAPFGWGKDVIMRESLILAGRPAHRTLSMSRLSTERRLAEALLQFNPVSEEEMLEIESDFSAVLPPLQKAFEDEYGDIGNCLLFFLYANLNQDYAIPKAVLTGITALSEAGFRCVVESWDVDQISFGRILDPQSIAFFPDERHLFPRLSPEEIDEWLTKRDMDQEDVRFIVEQLAGHPLHIRETLNEFLRTRSSGLAISSEMALEAAVNWLDKDGTDFVKYERYVETSLGGNCDPFIVQWAALVRDIPFPAHRLTREQQKQTETLVRLGLARAIDGQICPLGWFSFYCYSRLRRETAAPLLLEPQHFSAMNAAVRERIVRDLLDDHVDVPVAFRAQVLGLAKSMQRIKAKESEEEEDDAAAPVLAATPAAVSLLASEVGPIESEDDMSFAIYTLDQLSRNALWTTSQALWKQVLTRDHLDLLATTVNHDWPLLGILARAFYVAGRIAKFDCDSLKVLFELVGVVELGGHGHRFHAARLLVSVGLAFCRNGDRSAAAETIALLRDLMEGLPRHEPGDYRYTNRCDIEYRFHILSHMVAEGHVESAESLKEALRIVEDVLGHEPDNLRWQTRYLRLLDQLGDVLYLERGHDFRIHTQSILQRMGDSIPLTVRLLRRNWGLEDVEEEKFIDSVLADVAKLVWHDHRITKRHLALLQGPFVLICGVLCRDHDAVAWATGSVSEYFHNPDHSSVRAKEEALLLAVSLVRIAGEYTEPVTIDGKKQYSLRSFLIQFVANRIPSLESIRPTVSQAVITSFLRAVVSNYHRNAHTLVDDCEDRKPSDYLKRQMILFDNPYDSLVKRLIKTAMACPLVDLVPVMRRHLRFAREKWQKDLHVARHFNEPLPEYDNRYQDVIKLYENRLDGRSALKFEEARAERYIWNHERALQLAEEAYGRAMSFEERGTILRFLLDAVLIPSVFTPRSLRTSHVPPDDGVFLDKLRHYGQIYLTLYPDESWRRLYLETIERGEDPAFWEEVLPTIERRLGPLEDYWEQVSREPITSESGAFAEEAVRDLTDSIRLRMIAHPLRWASDLPSLPAALRLRIGESAVRCAFAGRQWLLGLGYASNHGATYGLACSIFLTCRIAQELQMTPHVRILGAEECRPIVGKGVSLPWFKTLEKVFAFLMNPAQTQGHFHEHVREIWEKAVRPAHKIYVKGLRAERKHHESGEADTGEETAALEPPARTVNTVWDLTIFDVLQQDLRVLGEVSAPAPGNEHTGEGRTEIFVSYAHDNNEWRERLFKMLKPALPPNTLVWYDGDIKPGDNWRLEIESAMRRARGAVLMVSQEFLASDFIKNEEVPFLLEQAKENGVPLTWLLLNAAMHEGQAFEDYQALHDVKKPLKGLSSHECDETLKEIAQKIVAMAH